MEALAKACTEIPMQAGVAKVCTACAVHAKHAPSPNGPKCPLSKSSVCQLQLYNALLSVCKSWCKLTRPQWLLCLEAFSIYSVCALASGTSFFVFFLHLSTCTASTTVSSKGMHGFPPVQSNSLWYVIGLSPRGFEDATKYTRVCPESVRAPLVRNHAENLASGVQFDSARIRPSATKRRSSS